MHHPDNNLVDLSHLEEVKNNPNDVSAKFGCSEGLENFDTARILEEDAEMQNSGMRNI